MENWKIIWNSDASEQRLKLEALHPRFGGWIQEILKDLKKQSGPLFQDVPEGFGICVFRDEWGEEMKIFAKVDFSALFFTITGIELKARAWKYWNTEQPLTEGNAKGN